VKQANIIAVFSIMSAAPLQEEEAFNRAEDTMVIEKRDPRADERSSVEIEKTHPVIFKVEFVALGQHHPRHHRQERPHYWIL
jgi:hypothetical protein